MTETSTSYEYRLSWESINPIEAAVMEQRMGRGWFSRLSPEKREGLSWQEPTVRIDTNPWDQFNTLRAWAESYEEPIRNVKLERRTVPLPDEGWEEVPR